VSGQIRVDNKKGYPEEIETWDRVGESDFNNESKFFIKASTERMIMSQLKTAIRNQFKDKSWDEHYDKKTRQSVMGQIKKAC